MVMTPVPPMPVIRMPNDFSSEGIAGSSREKGSPAETAPALPFLNRPPSTVTKLGQKPLTHE